jgi:hypothetical protein
MSINCSSHPKSFFRFLKRYVRFRETDQIINLFALLLATREAARAMDNFEFKK